MATPDPHAAVDAALVAAMANGEQRAAAELYDRHSGLLLALALRITGQQADAEEVVLDAFMQAWRSALQYDPERATVAGWLTTIARTRALDLVRARTRRERVTDQALVHTDDAPVAMSTAAPDPVQEIEDAERGVVIGRAMEQLPDKQRHAIELSFYEGLTHAEIASRLMEPLGTVKTRIRLGMTRLRDALGASLTERRP